MLARVLGMILFIFGFIMLLANAIDYLSGFFRLSSDVTLPSSGVSNVFSVLVFICKSFFDQPKRVIGDAEKCTIGLCGLGLGFCRKVII